MKTSSTLAAALCMLGLIGVARMSSAQVTKTGGAYLLRMKFFKGQKLSYLMTSSSTGVKMEIPFIMNVTDVTGNVATINLTVGPASVNGKRAMNGNTPAKAQVVTIQMDNRGKVVKSSQPGAQGMAGVVLPEKPIRIGETFPVDSTTPMGGMNMKVTGRYRFAGIKNVNGKQAAQLAVMLSGSGTGGAAMKISTKGSGTTNLDIADGQLRAAAINQEITIIRGANSQTQKNAVQIRRK
jgi:hypothetical protein